MKTKIVISALVGAVMSITFAVPAIASVVTFEDKPAFSCTGGNTADGGLNFTSDFATCYYSPSSPADFPTPPPSTVMATGFSNTTVTKTAGGPFSLESVDLAFGPFSHSGLSSDTTLVTGNLHGGGTLSKLLTVNYSFQTYQLDWANLDSVVFSQLQKGSEYLTFDNVTYDSNAVPEPSSIGLFGIALAALVLIKRRRSA